MNPVLSTPLHRFGWFARHYDPRLASARLRMLGPLAALREDGVAIEPWRAGAADRYDALLFSKTFSRRTVRIARAACAAGRPILVDMCDNELEKAGRKGRAAKQERIAGQLDRATLVTVPTAALGEQLASAVPGLADKLRIVPDMLDDPARLDHAPSLADRWHLARLRRFLGRHAGALHCVWFGNSSGNASGLAHLDDAMRALDLFSAGHPVTLTLIGDERRRFARATQNLGVPHFYLPWSLGSFAAALTAHRVALIPVRRNAYTVGKSINRPATALLAGLGVVADAIDSYEELRPYIALDDWQAGLHRYAFGWADEQPRLAAGRAYLESRYGQAAVADRWRAVLDELWPPN